MAKKTSSVKEDNGLTIDFKRKHISFGANLVPTKIKLEDSRFLPLYANDYAAAADVVVDINEGVPGAKYDSIQKKWFVSIPYRTLVKANVGFALELPAGWKAEIVARSGWAKRGLVVTNAPGQIDEDYRGPVSVLLGNVGKEIINVFDGDKVAQIHPAPVFRFDFEQVDKLESTERGGDGFGSTGF